MTIQLCFIFLEHDEREKKNLLSEGIQQKRFLKIKQGSYEMFSI